MPESIGRIARLQVHTDRVKTRGVGYDPEPIVEVERAAIGPAGIVGFQDGGWLVDVHHPSHPHVVGGGTRAVSVGFTGHYASMGERFGRVPLGVAGENIIVDAAGLRALDLGAGVVIRTESGPIELSNPVPMAPCVEFTSFLVGADALLERHELGDHLEFLEAGTRGFTVDSSHLDLPVEVRVGDVVELLRP